MTDNAFMAKLTEIVKVSEGGRIVIPAAFRKALDLSVGDVVVLELDDDTLRLQPRAQRVRQALDRLYEQVKGGPSLVDELIAERRAEAARE